MKLRLTLAALAALGTLALAPAAHAQLAFDMATGSSLGTLGQSSSIGYSFTVLTPITVTELDVWTNGYGFSNATVPTGIWNSAGDLLTSAAISATAPESTTASATLGKFLGVSIAPLGLAAGTYTIGSQVSGDDDIYGGVPQSAASVSFGQTYIKASASLTDPVGTGGDSGIDFGPSFKFTNTAIPSAVPEPGSIALLVGMTTVGAGVLRRKRRATVSGRGLSPYDK